MIRLIVHVLLLGALVSAAQARATTKSTKSTTETTTTISELASSVSEEIRKADSKSRGAAGKKAVIITISGQLAERSGSFALFADEESSLKDYLDLLRRMRDDSGVRSVIVRLTTAEFGLAMAQELRNAIREVRAKGKKVYGVIEDDAQPSYLVATACDEIILPPSADLMLYGVKADAYFFRSLLEKIGVKAHVLHVGQYKSYGEMFTEDDFTTPARENMTEIVDDVFSQMVQMIASSRKIEPAKVEAILNRGPQSAEEAKNSGLVDRVAYPDELLRELEKSGFEIVDSDDYDDQRSTRKSSADASLFSLFSMLNKQQTESSGSSKYPQVAVVYAVGPIMLGREQGMSIGSDEQIWSEDFIETLDEIQDEPKIKAVILRVNSPGGSAFASDLIWRKLQELKKTRPVIVSMGDVAASGGYYIAMAGSRIIAQEGTFTGSIGVVGGKLNLGEGYKKIGVKKTTISRGEFANLFSETESFSDREREAVERMMRRTYDDFVAKAAKDRKLPTEKLEQLAQGKVWLGARAKQVGLVDDTGGLDRAIQETKKVLGLRQDDKVSLIAYPKEVGLFDFLQKALGGSVAAQVRLDPVDKTLPRDLSNLLAYARKLVLMFERERVLTVLPFVPDLN